MNSEVKSLLESRFKELNYLKNNLSIVDEYEKKITELNNKLKQIETEGGFGNALWIKTKEQLKDADAELEAFTVNINSLGNNSVDFGGSLDNIHVLPTKLNDEIEKAKQKAEVFRLQNIELALTNELMLEQEERAKRLAEAQSVIADIAQGVSSAFQGFFDVITQGGGIGDALKEMFKSILNSVIQFVEGIFLATQAKLIADSVLTFGVALVTQLPQLLLGLTLLETAKGFINSFADGGYTGFGGIYEPAGVVHRGEYVVPHNMSYLFPVLEAIRSGTGSNATLPYVSGGYVNPLKETQNISVIVNTEFDKLRSYEVVSNGNQMTTIRGTNNL